MEDEVIVLVSFPEEREGGREERGQYSFKSSRRLLLV